EMPSFTPLTISGTDSQRAKEAIEGEVQVFRTRKNSRLTEISVQRERIGQLKQLIIGLRDMIRTKVSLEISYSSEITELK
ncbi:HlyD family type I secretion periplasmic adaptor subunit, partial [Pseudomonas syringae pv. tagetis]